MLPNAEIPLRNLAASDPVARLSAIHALGVMLRAELNDWIDHAELAQVRVARGRKHRASWEEIGRALGGVSHIQARRRFVARLRD